MIWGGADVIVIEIKYAINVCVWITTPLPSQSIEKLSSMKPVPDAENFGVRCSKPFLGPSGPPPTHIWLLHARSLWVLSPCSHSLFLNRIFPQKEGVSLTLFPPYLLPLLTAHLNTIFSLGLFELAFLFMALWPVGPPAPLGQDRLLLGSLCFHGPCGAWDLAVLVRFVCESIFTYSCTYSKSPPCKWVPLREHVHKSNLFVSQRKLA